MLSEHYEEIDGGRLQYHFLAFFNSHSAQTLFDSTGAGASEAYFPMPSRPDSKDSQAK